MLTLIYHRTRLLRRRQLRHPHRKFDPLYPHLSTKPHHHSLHIQFTQLHLHPPPFFITQLTLFSFPPPLQTDIIMAREAQTNHRFGDKPYLGFEHVTMVPMCRNLIDASLLTPREREWLNVYHAQVLETTRSYFDDDERALRWVERETKPI